MSPIGAFAAALTLFPPLQEAPPPEVEVRFALLDVFKIDGADQSAELDFMLLLTWKDPAPAADLSKAWNPRLLPVGARRPIAPTWEDLRRGAGGTLTRVYRYTGSFPVQMQLRDFPLDQHTLQFRFAVPRTPPEALRFVPGPSGRSNLSLSIPDWIVDAGAVAVKPVEFPEFGVRLASFSLDLPVRRRLGYALWGVMLPILCIILMAWTVFWLTPAHFAQKVGTSTTSILTLIAYRFVFASMVPKLPYLTRMDHFMIGATLLVFAAFLKVVAEGILVAQKREERAARLDRTLRWVFPGLVAAVAAWSFIL